MAFEIEKIAKSISGDGNGFEIERIANNVGGGSGSSSGGGLVIPEYDVDDVARTATCNMTYSEIEAAIIAGRC